MAELVLTPTRAFTEGTGSSNAPYIVASDLSGGASVTAWTDGSDASYGKSDAGRTSRGQYAKWVDVDATIDPTWITAIGVRFRASSHTASARFAVQLFAQVSKLLSNPFHGGSAPLTTSATPDTWTDFDYVVPAADYDPGWAPFGITSAADPTLTLYCRTVPTDATGEFTSGDVILISEQSIVIYYSPPDSGDGIPPVTDPPPYGGGSAPPPDNGGGTGPGTGGPPPDPAGGGGYQTISIRRQAPTTAQIVVDGHWLTGLCPWGDLSWSHVWPGGSGNASWSAEQVPASLRKRGLLVQLMIGAECIWSGPQTEPDPSGLTMSAAGLWTIGPDWIALDAVGNASVIPDEAIDAAIGRGMPWKRKTSISTSAVDIDVSQGPTTIGALLDAYALDATQRWGVTPDGYVICQPDPVFPTWHVLPLDGGLTPADNFATRLFGRYYTGSTYGTAQVSSDPGNNGAREATVDLTGFGPIMLAKAERKLQALLDLGLSRPSWANPIVVGYGDILSPGAVAVGLEQPIAGDLVRVHGHIDETQSVGGAMWTDVLMGQTDVSDETLTLTPMGMPARTLTDVLALAAQSKKGA